MCGAYQVNCPVRARAALEEDLHEALKVGEVEDRSKTAAFKERIAAHKKAIAIAKAIYDSYDDYEESVADFKQSRGEAESRYYWT